MNLDKYIELTGIEVHERDKSRVNAQIRRTKSKLENLLGFTLDRNKINTNTFNELGKTQGDCSCLGTSTPIENLLKADDVEGSYRVFRFNSDDTYFFVDPFVKVYNVKLVQMGIRGNEGDGITIRTFDKDKIRSQVGRDGIAKYIQRCKECLCECNCKDDCVQLAVDADWVFQDCLPDDLMYIWADMVTHYADCKKGVKSESIGGHSYTLQDKVAPELDEENLKIIQRYVGPYGSVNNIPV